MSYAKPAFTSKDYNLAGRRLRNMLETPIEETIEDLSMVLPVLDNFRASHSYPLNSLHMTLKNRAARVDVKSLTSQRIKRLVSIAQKLWDKHDMKLSQMQDIGGCRAILPTLKDIYSLLKIYKSKPLIHKFIGEKDYIAVPRNTGYRGIHLKYRFHGSGSSKPWDGLKIEIQLRTALQHQWATAVEAAGTFTKEALKSNQGRKEWLRFFSLTSSLFALKEGCATVPGTPGNFDELLEELRALNNNYHILAAFSQFNAIIPQIEKQKQAKYFLVVLNPITLTVIIREFMKHESQQANKAYTETEKRLGPDSLTQVVLVSVASISALKKAYPNYFLDTSDFLKEVKNVLLDQGELFS